MRRFVRPNALLFSFALAVGLVWAMATSAGETAKKIRIIYTTDTMGYLEPCG